MKSCASPLSDEVLVSYWVGDLEEAASAGVEEHLFSCPGCTAAAERVAIVAGAIRELIPPVISRAEVDALRARGLVVVENPVEVGQRKTGTFAPGVDILLHVLHGMDLSNAEKVHVTVSDEESGAILNVFDEAPFDRERGEVLIACQRHFAVFPPNIIFDVRAREVTGIERSGRFVVPHLFSL